MSLRHSAADFTEDMMERPEKYVPEGMYCYRGLGVEGNAYHTVRCPFLDRESDLPRQDDGYCHLLGEGDWGTDAESLDRPWSPEMLDERSRKSWEEEGFVLPPEWDGRTLREFILASEAAYAAGDKVLGKTLLYATPMVLGLLWDACKECGINDEWEPGDEEADEDASPDGYFVAYDAESRGFAVFGYAELRAVRTGFGEDRAAAETARSEEEANPDNRL